MSQKLEEGGETQWEVETVVMDGDRTTTIKPDFHFPVTPSYFAGKGSFSLLPSRDTARFDPRPARSFCYFLRRDRVVDILSSPARTPNRGYLSPLSNPRTRVQKIQSNDTTNGLVIACRKSSRRRLTSFQ